MEVRSFLNSKAGIITVCVIVALLLGTIFFRGTIASGPKHELWIPGHFYTADEGQTKIADSWMLVPPFERDGQTYVRAYFFKADDKSEPFLGYLEKWDANAQAQILSEQEQRLQAAVMNDLGNHGLLVKRPGDTNWVPKDQAAGITISRVLIPGTDQPAKPFFPNLPPKPAE